MTTLLQNLKDNGADIESAMARFVDDEDLYEACFDMFLEDENFPMLENALKAHDYPNAFDAAHALKGVAGNLGLTPLYDAICDIVEPLRASDYTNLNDEYQNIVTELDKLKNINR